MEQKTERQILKERLYIESLLANISIIIQPHSNTQTLYIYIYMYSSKYISIKQFIYIYTPGTDLQEHAHTYMYMCYIHADQQLQSCASTPIKALNLHNMMQVLNMKHTLDSQYLRPGGGRDLDSNPRRRGGQRQQQRNNASSSSSRALDVADRALRIVEKATEKW